MKTNRIAFLCMCFFAASLSLNAQEHKRCGSTEADLEFKIKHPELVPQINSLQEYLNTIDVTKLERTRANKLIIPIVFHIIHNYGPENISDAQILDAVKILNRDFQKLNADTSTVIPEFRPLIANCDFEFRLAAKDPQGNCTNGIDRIASYKTYLAGDQSKLNSWNPAYYFNIWVVNSIGSNGVAGYAYKPATAAFIFYYDGVIILHDYVGSIGTGSPQYSRALTHEVGHCMNLDHTWGSTNNPGVSCGDDNVLDTPQTQGHDNCTTLYDSTCTPGILENIQNYMEYSYCSHMFTHGQADRMRVTLTNSVAQRSTLVSPLAHQWSGILLPKPDCPPIADFSVNRQFGCPSSTFAFRNRSYNDTITGVNWLFPSDATQSAPISMTLNNVTFSNLGWKDVGIEATANSGIRSTNRANYIYIADPVGKVVTGQINSFEDVGENAKWPMFNYANNTFKWDIYDQGNVYAGWKALHYKAYDDRVFPADLTLSQKSDWDETFTTAYDLSGLSSGNAFLNFYMAGATAGSTLANMEDTLFLYYSVNCGQNWILLKSFQKNTLFNNGTQLAQFKPTPTSAWMPVSVSLPGAALTNSTFFKLRMEPGELSNDIYIDNWEINSTPVGIKDADKLGYYFQLVPNPANNNVAVQLNANVSGKASITVTNMIGATIYSTSLNVNSGSRYAVTLPFERFTAKGVYLVTTEIDHKKSTQKLVIE